MHDPLAMRLIQRVSDLDATLEWLVERQRPLFEPLDRGFAFDEFHDQEVDPVLVSDIVEGADVRVVEAGDRLGFPLGTAVSDQGRRRHVQATP